MKPNRNAKIGERKAGGKAIALRAPRPKPAGVVKSEEERDARFALGKRRSFTTIDRLPESVRETLLERLGDPAFTYSDLQDFTLIETCPTEAGVRAEVTRLLDEAYAKAFETPRNPEGSGAGGTGGAHGRGAGKRQRERGTRYAIARRKACEWARAACDRHRLGSPTLLTDDALSRAYTSFVRTRAELTRCSKMFRSLIESGGDLATMSMVETTAQLLITKVQVHVDEADNFKKLNALNNLLNTTAQWYKAIVAGEKAKQSRAHVVETVHRRYIQLARDEFAADPDLNQRVFAVLERAREGAAQ